MDDEKPEPISPEEWRREEMKRDPEGHEKWERRLEFLFDPRHQMKEWQGRDWWPREQKEHEKRHGREREHDGPRREH